MTNMTNVALGAFRPAVRREKFDVKMAGPLEVRVWHCFVGHGW